MERNTKILLGLAGAGVLAYLLFKSSKAQAQTTTKPTDLPNLPSTIKNGAVIDGKKWVIKTQADCPSGYNFGNPPPQPCYRGNKNCDSGGPRCYKIVESPPEPQGQADCPKGTFFTPSWYTQNCKGRMTTAICKPPNNPNVKYRLKNECLNYSYDYEYGYEGNYLDQHLSDYGSGYATGY